MNVLGIPQAREIAGTLAGQILNVLGVYWVGTCMVLCPFPCNVFVMYWPRTLALAPSEGVPARACSWDERMKSLMGDVNAMANSLTLPVGVKGYHCGDYPAINTGISCGGGSQARFLSLAPT